MPHVLPKDDTERFALARRELFTAVVGDIMDAMGLQDQFLPPQIQPLRDDMIVVGRAATVMAADDAGGEGPGRATENLNRPFGLMLRALDELKPNDVYVCTGNSPRYALWGELMSTAARNRGAVGCVVNGYSRDTRGIYALGFPTFSLGRYAQDQRARGKVVDIGCTIRIDRTTIRPGDVIFGDIDGVCVIPRDAEDEVLTRALEKATGERTVFEAIKKGMGAQEAWDKFGIL